MKEYCQSYENLVPGGGRNTLLSCPWSSCTARANSR